MGKEKPAEISVNWRVFNFKTNMKHIILLGDSIFDNKSYINGGLDVRQHLRLQMAEEYTEDDAAAAARAGLLAVDGSLTTHVPSQLKKMPHTATHLFLSIGGNDALAESDMLNQKVAHSSTVFNDLADRVQYFEERYQIMLKQILKRGLPTTLCTVYYPRMEDALYQKLAVAGLAAFNDIIIKQAILNRLPIIDLRFVCNDDADYANSIEPSEMGGFKIAQTILRVANEHDFDKKQTVVYF
jgi:hypothetical protein